MSTIEPTWEPFEETGEPATRSNLPETVFAFPKQHKEPMTDAQHVRNAVARFDQVLDVSDADRELAFANIEKAADYYGVKLSETNWHQLGVHPNRHRFEAAAKAAETRDRHSEEGAGRKP
ncbi:MAG TPA: DUF6582 domain-containing protein [Acidobacteriaceae bacterium]|jgi:hypothetical protein|nr:DUF6582 domain-containing protein [Acidobacteriaceae bacterium]